MAHHDPLTSPRVGAAVRNIQIPRRVTHIKVAGVGGPRAWAIALAVVALLIRAPLFLDSYDPATTPDSAWYLGIADGILHGGSDASDGAPESWEPIPSNRRPIGEFRGPGYPLFVAAASVLPGDREDTVVILQHLLGVLLTAAIVLLAWRWFDKPTAIAAGLFAAITPVLTNVEHDITPDFLFGVGLLAGAALLIEAITRPEVDRRLLLAAGLAFGLTALIKPTTQIMVLAGIVPLAFATRSLRRTLIGSAIVALGVAIIVVPWMVRNTIAYGHFTFNTTSGVALYIRVFDADRLPMPTDDPESARVNRIYQAGLAKTPPNTVASTAYDVIRDYGPGVSLYEKSKIEGRLARKAILAHPAKYTRNTWADLKAVARLTARYDLPRFELDTKLDRADPPVGGGIVRRIWRASGWLNDLWWLLSLGGLSALFAMWLRPAKERAAAAALYWSWLLVAAGTAATIPPVERYAAQGAPLLWIASFAGLVSVATALTTYARQRRTAA
jgi:4-amino-4-deoxy-L-arabinose transferase-like glycosyltransferase